LYSATRFTSPESEVRPQASLVSEKWSRAPLDVIVLGLLLWLPIETWALRFVPNGSLMLVIPDLLSWGAGLALIGMLIQSNSLVDYSWRHRWFLGPLLAFAATAALSALVNGVAPLEVAYWARVYLRFVPLAAIAACAPWTQRVMAKLPAVIALSLGFQLETALFEAALGRRAAEIFWPGSFQLGSVQTAVTTLSGVQDRFVGGTTGHYNILAWYIVLASAVLLSYVLSTPGRLGMNLRTVALVELIIAGLVLVLSQSRQAFFVVALAAVPLAVYLDRELGIRGRIRKAYSGLGTALRHLVPVVGVALVLVIGVLAIPRVAHVADRYSAIFTAGYWRVAGDNRGYAIGTIVPRVADEAPVLGMGPGSFGREWTVDAASAPPAVKRLDLDLHHWRYLSDVGWASIFAQTGLVGVLCLLGLLFGMARIAWNDRRRPSFVIMAACALTLLGPGMVAGAPLTYKATSSLFWVLVGLTFGMAGTMRTSATPESMRRAGRRRSRRARTTSRSGSERSTTLLGATSRQDDMPAASTCPCRAASG